MTESEIIKRYLPDIERFLRYAYSDGYKNGHKQGTEEVERLRSECCREAGENDSEYAKNWRDNTDFYGWCNLCKRPHSGRWAHIWEYCPWCGARINQEEDKQPYLYGFEEYQNWLKSQTDEEEKITKEDIALWAME